MRSRSGIVVVDDDPHHAALLRGVLATGLEGAVVSIVTSARTLNALLRGQWPFDTKEHLPPLLIVTSLELPGLDGPDIVDLLLQEAAADIPVIAFGPADRIESLRKRHPQAGFHYLLKPVDFQNLLELSNEALAGLDDADPISSSGA